ncbi:unnamed protein product [Diatraea saccharalis]|uniref:Peptidase M14 domain-containing protein n=1 Tax=Diatraea saccharalis TaxID=40085 RepID=A0A9N9R444_9NEOP|nr:unnamed protein product [Diatraea saccharalis]
MEYNDIVLMKITEKKSDFERHFRADDNKYADDVPEKKIVFIVHALSVMGLKDDSCLKNITQFKKLLSYYFVHLDKFDIFLIPMANPDGFMQTFVNVYANKNMSPQSACSGVALDRNFDVAWNDSTSISSCSPQYPGPRPFSEPESRAIRDVLHRYSHKLLAYIHVHAGSYNHEIFKGHAVLYPKGYTDVQSDDDKYIDLRGEIDEAMKNASFHVMSVAVDTLYNWYGKVSGTSVDYASTIYGIPYALEFVMQPYETIYLETAALEQIWKRIIDVTFNNIFRSMENFEFK